MIKTIIKKSSQDTQTKVYKLDRRGYTMVNDCIEGMGAVTHIRVNPNHKLKDGCLVVVQCKRTGVVDIVQYIATSMMSKRLVTLEYKAISLNRVNIVGVVSGYIRTEGALWVA